jgi:ketosteroid isomerase-like protein
VIAENQRLSTTFVVQMPDGSVVRGPDILKRFAAGTMRYDRIEQRIDYAGSHGPDVVVLMGEETVVAGSGPAAGKPVRRRFTDVFRRENGEWRHDLRHASVITTP